MTIYTDVVLQNSMEMVSVSFTRIWGIYKNPRAIKFNTELSSIYKEI